MTMPRRQLVDVAVTRYYHVSAHHRHRPRGADGGGPGQVRPFGQCVAELA
jgi:hypothetical protein